jgi:hypothetical protein
MKKRLALLLSAVLLLSLYACGKVPKTEPKTVIISYDSISAWYDEAQPEDSTNQDLDTLRVSRSANGPERYTFLRLPMQTDIFANELQSARLRLKVNTGNGQPKLKAGYVQGPWDYANSTRAEAKPLAGRLRPVKTLCEEANGWLSFDVTEYVKGWLSGSAPNYGLALFAANKGTDYAFVASNGRENADVPQLELRYWPKEHPITYGKFGYARQPVEGDFDSGEFGNCMSYALRDTDRILGGEGEEKSQDMAYTYRKLNELYQQGGEEAVLVYIAGLVRCYVETHAAGLQISSFRQLERFDSSINPAKEYRAALRIGCKAEPGEAPDLSAKNAFDFHWWMQLNDGRWAQKFPTGASEILPCTGPGIDPGKYPWHASKDFGLWKHNDYYTSRVVYFAVTKDTEAFTAHKG